MTQHSVRIAFDDNRLLAQLFGEHNHILARLEEAYDVSVASRGEMVSLSGAHEGVIAAERTLKYLYDQLKAGEHVSDADIEAVIRLQLESANAPNDNDQASYSGVIQTPRKRLKAYTETQASYIKALQEKEVVLAAGPAGTGKTYIAVAAAVAAFAEGRVDRIILSRPAVEAGEHLGFLPGDMKEKVDPYLRPLYDALYDMMSPEKVVRSQENGQIEIAPLAFMRGRTLRNAFVILDEAQNTTPMQMKMFLTRLGEGTQMVVTGDLSQVDLPGNVTSGLRDALDKLKDIPEIGIIRFSGKDVVRHPLTTKIVNAYEQSTK